jgi:hypothetical protein
VFVRFVRLLFVECGVPLAIEAWELGAQSAA